MARGASVGSLSIMLAGNSAPLIRTMNQAETKLRQFSTRVNNTVNIKMAGGGGGGGGGLGIGGLIGGNLATSAIQGVARHVSDVARTTLRLAANAELAAVEFEVLTGSVEEGAKLIQDIESFAVASPYDSAGLTQATRLLKAFGLENDQLLPTLKALGDVAMGSAERLQGLALVYGQVKAQGRMIGADLRQFSNNMVGVEHFAETMGVTVAEVMKLKEEGKLTFDVVAKTFNRMTAEGGAFYNMMAKQSGTVMGQWNAFSENIEVTLKRVGLAFFEGFGVTDLLRQASDGTIGLRDSVAGLVPYFRKAREAFDVLVAGFKAAGRVGADWIGSILGGLGEIIPRWDDFKAVATTAVRLTVAGIGGLIGVLDQLKTAFVNNFLKPLANTLKALDGRANPLGDIVTKGMAAGKSDRRMQAEVLLDYAMFKPMRDTRELIASQLGGAELEKFNQATSAAANFGEALDRMADSIGGESIGVFGFRDKAMAEFDKAMAGMLPDPRNLAAGLGAGLMGPFGAAVGLNAGRESSFLDSIAPLKSASEQFEKAVDNKLPKALARGSQDAERAINRYLYGSKANDPQRQQAEQLKAANMKLKSIDKNTREAARAIGGGIVGVNF